MGEVEDNASAFVHQYDEKCAATGVVYTAARTRIAVIGIRQELAAHGAAIVQIHGVLSKIFFALLVLIAQGTWLIIS